MLSASRKHLAKELFLIISSGGVGRRALGELKAMLEREVEPEDVKAQAKTVTPTFAQQVITPDTAQGYTHLSQVTVGAIPVTYADNSAGGVTVTIGSAA